MPPWMLHALMRLRVQVLLGVRLQAKVPSAKWSSTSCVISVWLLLHRLLPWLYFLIQSLILCHISEHYANSTTGRPSNISYLAWKQTIPLDSKLLQHYSDWYICNLIQAMTLFLRYTCRSPFIMDWLMKNWSMFMIITSIIQVEFISFSQWFIVPVLRGLRWLFCLFRSNFRCIWYRVTSLLHEKFETWQSCWHS